MGTTTPKTITKYYTEKTKIWASVMGDMCIVAIPIMQQLIQNAPNLTKSQVYWWTGFCTIAAVIAKFVLKAIKENSNEIPEFSV